MITLTGINFDFDIKIDKFNLNLFKAPDSAKSCPRCGGRPILGIVSAGPIENNRFFIFCPHCVGEKKSDGAIVSY